MVESIKKIYEVLKRYSGTVKQKAIIVIIGVLLMLMALMGCGALELTGTSTTDYKYMRKGKGGEQIEHVDYEDDIRR